MTRYAKTTNVTSDRSRVEIEKILTRYGADQFLYGWEENEAILAFRVYGRHIKFVLPLPDQCDERFTHTLNHKVKRSPEKSQAFYEQAVRQRWRALALVIKAKLEAVETGITEFEDEFMAHIVLPSGETVGQWMRPQIAIAYDRGDMPPLLPGPKK